MSLHFSWLSMLFLCPTPIFLPGEPHGQRSLKGCSPWGHKESDMTEWLNHHHHVVLTVWVCFFFLSIQILKLFVLPKKSHWYLDRICIISADCLEYCGHFNNVNSSNPRMQCIFLSFNSMQVKPFQGKVGRRVTLLTAFALSLWESQLGIAPLFSIVCGICEWNPL